MSMEVLSLYFRLGQNNPTELRYLKNISFGFSPLIFLSDKWTRFSFGIFHPFPYYCLIDTLSKGLLSLFLGRPVLPKKEPSSWILIEQTELKCQIFMASRDHL